MDSCPSCRDYETRLQTSEPRNGNTFMFVFVCCGVGFADWLQVRYEWADSAWRPASAIGSSSARAKDCARATSSRRSTRRSIRPARDASTASTEGYLLFLFFFYHLVKSTDCHQRSLCLLVELHTEGYPLSFITILLKKKRRNAISACG